MGADLAGRTALVTGGAKGIGRACCEYLARAGANVAVNYRYSLDEANRTARAVEKAGSKAHVVRADVSSEHDVAEMVTQVEQELGPVELLVNNAGVFDHVSHTETTPEIWRRAIDNNLTSAYLVSWAVKDGMLERGYGRIVNVASIAALRARPMSIAYSVSKAGMIALTKGLAEAVAPAVRVNAVAPGLIETEILRDVEPSKLDDLVEKTPLRRIGQPDDVAELVVFLLSSRSRFVTGQTLVASGGRVMLP